MMTDKQYKDVGHSLGINTYGAVQSDREKDRYLPEEFYRNYYCWGDAENGPSDSWDELVRNGLADVDTQRGQIYYFVSDKGILKFRELFTERVTATFVRPSKGKTNYMDYLHDDGPYTFAEFLGIEVPKREEYGGRYRFVSTKYDGVYGELRETVKEAKVSYKEKLKEYKKEKTLTI